MVVVVEEGDVFQGPFPLIYILVLTLSYKAVPLCFHRKIKYVLNIIIIVIIIDQSKENCMYSA